MQFRAIFLLELLLACLLLNTLVAYPQQDPPGRVVQGISIDDARRRLIGDVSVQSRIGCGETGEYCTTSSGCCSTRCHVFLKRCVT
ncbi:unnamed protein product [Hermetia illucens]|uniref:Uncharacterized protein n=1 Tax=Hermetia illucens TaxID=343691 RepID=A0A7R8YZ05_HERIL|nr:unnamed protein product [Hermetia illucens]